MPTGYTDSIKDDISFRQFALNCARAFGATIALRDENNDVTPTPENVKFNGESYHAKQLHTAEEKLKKFNHFDDQELNRQFEEWREKSISDAKDKIEQNNKLREKYEKMLAEVENWTPPTSEHFGMKEFMVKQIKESVDFDCSNDYYENRIKEAESYSLEGWKADELKSLNWSVNYHEKEMEEDKARDDSRSKWVADLLDSLPSE